MFIPFSFIITFISPFLSVLYTLQSIELSLFKTSLLGIEVNRFPTLINAILGFTLLKNSSEVEVIEP